MTPISHRFLRRRALAASLVLALAALATGCVSTETLYAAYDERACRVAIETSSAGGVRVRELGTERTMHREPLIGFAHDDVLAASERRRLDRDAAVPRAYPTLRASVRGFTDARGVVDESAVRTPQGATGTIGVAGGNGASDPGDGRTER